MKKLSAAAKNLSILFVLIGIFTASGAAQEAGEDPPRKVENNVLTSSAEPEIRLRFDGKFKFAGSQKFVLYDRAEAEQFFFVEAENKKIKRLYMLQFEKFLPGIDGAYNYEETRKAKIGAADYLTNIEHVPDVETALRAVPGSDIARAAEFLKGKGFTVMKSIVYERFVRVLGNDRRSEFIMLYIEGAETPNLEKQKANLEKQALKKFKVLK